MKILAVSTWFPYPPDNGSKMRSYHLLKHLGERHTLDLLALRQSDDDLRHLGVLGFCRRVNTYLEPEFEPSGLRSFAGLFSPTPRYFQAHHSPGLAAELREWIANERYDAVVAVTLGSAPYVAPLDTSARKVLDEHNVECQVIRRQACEEQSAVRKLRHIPTWLKAESYERRLAARFDAVGVVSEQESSLFRSLVRGEQPPAEVIPNGVDPGLLDFAGAEKEHDLLAFTGALSYDANRDAAVRLCREVLPLVRGQIPEARVWLTGRATDTDRREFGAIPGVEMTGYVDDIRPVVASASVLVTPLRYGGGTRLKILEAMALGTPVVSTPMGAEGIAVGDGREIMLANTVDGLADAVVRLLKDPDLAAEIAARAREMVRDRYQWPAIAAEFEKLVVGEVS